MSEKTSETQICPIMSGVGPVSASFPMVIEKPCIGSRCVSWRADSFYQKRGNCRLIHSETAYCQGSLVDPEWTEEMEAEWRKRHGTDEGEIETKDVTMAEAQKELQE